MDQNMAQALFREGAFLIISDMPINTEFGIDWNSWNTGPNFLGVKMIPPGVHFIFYSAKNKFSDISPRTGFFMNFERHQIVTKKWDHTVEEIVNDVKTDEELQNIRMQLQNLDSKLGAYPYESLKKWMSLTDQISPSILNKLNPENGSISSVPEMVLDESRTADDAGSSSKRVRNVDKDGLPLMKTKLGTEIHFTNLPRKWYPKDASPSEVSKYSMDSSYILKETLKTYDTPIAILGELQYSFVCFILGQVYDAFEQWKKLVHVLCYCEEDLIENENIYVAFVSLLYYQLLEIPEDFFVDIVTSNNFLVPTLNILFNNISASDLKPEFKLHCLKFRKYLTKKFKWNFIKEPDDWAPVIVDV